MQEPTTRQEIEDKLASERLSAAAAADLLCVHRSTVKRWIDAGKLPAFKTPGGHWRVRRVDVERVMREADTFTVPEGALRTVCPFCGEPIEDGQETMVDARRTVHADCVRRIVRGQSKALNGWARGKGES